MVSALHGQCRNYLAHDLSSSVSRGLAWTRPEVLNMVQILDVAQDQARSWDILRHSCVINSQDSCLRRF